MKTNFVLKAIQSFPIFCYNFRRYDFEEKINKRDRECQCQNQEGFVIKEENKALYGYVDCNM